MGIMALLLTSWMTLAKFSNLSFPICKTEGNNAYFIQMSEGVRTIMYEIHLERAWHTGKIQRVLEGVTIWFWIIVLIHPLNTFFCQNVMRFIVIERKSRWLHLLIAMFSRIVFLQPPFSLLMLINHTKYLLSCEQIPSHNCEAFGK